MNFLVIISDTFRKDNLACYGEGRAHTPHLDRLSSGSVVFHRAYANSFPTMPARADILTGRYTFTYRGWEPLDRSEVTLAEVLSSAGYATMGVVDTPFFQRDAYYYDKGFDDVIFIRGSHAQMADGRDTRLTRVHETDYAAPATFLAAERWLQRHYKEPFFLYVDTWDPHEPWDPPVWYTQRYDPDFAGPHPVPAYGKYRERGFTDAELARGYAAYRGEVTMVDRWVGRLLDTLESVGRADDTAVIFISDHGYYFGEHGYYGKSVMSQAAFGELAPNPAGGAMNFIRSPLYEEVVGVPLLIHAPEKRMRQTSALVSLADLMPTVLDLAGIAIPDRVHGHSLMPILDGEDRGKPVVVTSWPLYNIGERTRAVDSFERTVREPLPSTITTDDWQMLYTAEGIPAELYNLKDDPQQQVDVIECRADVAAELHRSFVALLEDCGTEERLLAPRRRL